MSNFKAFSKSFFISFLSFSLITLIVIFTTNISNYSKGITKNVVIPQNIKVEENHDLTTLIMISKDKISPPSEYFLIRFLPQNNEIVTTIIPKEIIINVNTQNKNLSDMHIYGGNLMVTKGIENKFDIKIDRFLKINDENLQTIINSFGGINLNNKNASIINHPDTEKFIDNNNNIIPIMGNTISQLLLKTSSEDNLEKLYQDKLNLFSEIILQIMEKINNKNIDSIYNSIINITDTNISFYDFEYRRDLYIQIKDNHGYKINKIIPQYKKDLDNNLIPRDLTTSLIQNNFKFIKK